MMLTSNVVLLFSLSVTGCFNIAGAKNDSDLQTKPVIPLNMAPLSLPNFGSSGFPIKILQFLKRILINIAGQAIEKLTPLVYWLTEKLIDQLAYLASSEDKRVAKRYEWSFHDATQSGEGQRSYPVRFASILSAAFMMPFKAAFGAVRLLPVDAIAKGTLKAFKPLGHIAKWPLIEKAINKTIIAKDAVILVVWEFAKVNVFPRLDNAANGLKESNNLPTVVLNYLNEVQSFYHICKVFGLA
ncbi:hypothetical protein TKK_0006148 [Trichogramma kaykai]|uniref:Uncharacterized protein n=1 Tax=Trichogramma kaykai TaxID=54128 RepID=A0ABD2XEI4_9HYME